jgi:hypothetical protein
MLAVNPTKALAVNLTVKLAVNPTGALTRPEHWVERGPETWP